MPVYGLSPLEIRHLIERAILPDRCECTVVDGVLTLRVTSATHPANVVTTTGIRLESLHASRAIAELVGEARYLLALKSNSQVDAAHRAVKQRIAHR